VLVAGCATPAPRGTKLIKAACPATEILTYTPEGWSHADQRAYETAQKRCVNFYPNSPCLKRFIRMEQLRYRAWCGSESEVHMFELEFLQ
jgi:hypothetical protein